MHHLPQVANREGPAMNPLLDQQRLRTENRRYRGSGGVSEGNRDAGFLPAFLDTHTGEVFLSRFADGRPAPCHLFDGLPGRLVAKWRADGRVAALKACVRSGFVRGGRFYSREQAARLA
jgi:hypothetical protein